MYDVFLTNDARRCYEDADPVLARKLNRCFRYLRSDPCKHPNIKRLKGPLTGQLRYRVGDWRVIYRVDEREKTVVVLLIIRRGRAYR